MKINENPFSLSEINDYLYKFETYPHTIYIRIQGLIPLAGSCLNSNKKTPPKPDARCLLNGLRILLATKL